MGCLVCGLRWFVRDLLLRRSGFVHDRLRRLAVRRLAIRYWSGDDLSVLTSRNPSLD